jgi:hypothetical protein
VTFSIGPDWIFQIETMSPFQVIQGIISAKSGGCTFAYNPTNGTASKGDIMMSNTFLK